MHLEDVRLEGEILNTLRGYAVRYLDLGGTVGKLPLHNLTRYFLMVGGNRFNIFL